VWSDISLWFWFSLSLIISAVEDFFIGLLAICMSSLKKCLVVAQLLTSPTRNNEVAGLIPGLAQWVKDPALLWLWCRPVATAPIRPLAWEPPCAAGAALEKAKTHTHTNVYSVPLSIFWGRGKCWAGSMQNPPGQGLNPCHSRDTTRSLTARPPGNSFPYFNQVGFFFGGCCCCCCYFLGHSCGIWRFPG